MKIHNYSSFLQKKSALSALIELQERQLQDSVLLNTVSRLKRNRNKKKKPLSLKQNMNSMIFQGFKSALSTLGYKWIKNSKLVGGRSKLMIGIAAIVIAKIVRNRFRTHHSR